MPKLTRRVEAAIRSGQFKVPASTAAQTITIVSGRTKVGSGAGNAGKDAVVYRVHNSSQSEFTVEATLPEMMMGMPVVISKTVKPECSLDIGTLLLLKISVAANTEVEGVYNNNLLSAETRSGHFKVAASSQADIITLHDETVEHRRPVYRIHNTGEDTLTVDLSSGTSLKVLKKSSVDVELKKSGGSTKTTVVTIKPDAGSAEGIYELLSWNE
jgi:hypothetical protein